MNNYEDWAQLVARKLRGEADVIAAIEKEELDDSAAAEAFVRAVLTPFLPENFGVGAGHIVDAFGNRSEYFDAIIYNRDFPRIGLRGIQSDYLYESVLAAFAIRAKYVRKTFFESMDACASLATLSTNSDKSVLVRLAKKNGLAPGPNKSFIHADPLHTTRFELIGCPPAFMFGFSGIKNSYRQLQENIELWIQQRQAAGISTPMRAFPAVITTQGCFAWRNAAPLALSNRGMLGIGNDPAPIRLIVLQMLYLLNRRLHATADGFGMKPSLSAYLNQFKAPKFEIGVGDVDQLVDLKLPPKTADADAPKSFEPARDHAPKAQPPATPKAAEPEPPATPEAVEPEAPVAPEPEAAVAAEPPAPVVPEAVDAQAVEVPETIAPETRADVPAGVFDKPSPFASAPAPAQQEPEPQEQVRRPPAAPLGSAPIPGTSSAQQAEAESMPLPETPAEPEATPAAPVAPLGSAPIPPSQPAQDIIPPIPPVDIDVTDIQIPGEPAEDATAEPAEELDYDSTVVIKPDAARMGKKQTQSSSDAFITRVKEQLSNPEKLPEKDEDSFSSTVPH